MTHRKYSYWSFDEESRFRQIYPDTSIRINTICRMFGRSRHCVYQKARQLDLHRPRKRRTQPPSPEYRREESRIRYRYDDHYRQRTRQRAVERYHRLHPNARYIIPPQ